MNRVKATATAALLLLALPAWATPVNGQEARCLASLDFMLYVLAQTGQNLSSLSEPTVALHKRLTDKYDSGDLSAADREAIAKIRSDTGARLSAMESKVGSAEDTAEAASKFFEGLTRVVDHCVATKPGG